jgi:hypothetical protein
MTADYEPKPFQCPKCAWHLGDIHREGSRRFTTLRVYRKARPPDQVVDINSAPISKLYAALHVYDGIVPCEHCGEFVPWFANQDAVSSLAKRVARRV